MKRNITATDRIDVFQCFHHQIDIIATGERTEVSTFALYFSHPDQSGIFFIGDLNDRITFIILEHDIELGLILFDQVGFEQQGFGFTIDDDIVKFRRIDDQSLGFVGVFINTVKIAR